MVEAAKAAAPVADTAEYGLVIPMMRWLLVVDGVDPDRFSLRKHPDKTVIPPKVAAPAEGMTAAAAPEPTTKEETRSPEPAAESGNKEDGNDVASANDHPMTETEEPSPAAETSASQPAEESNEGDEPSFDDTDLGMPEARTMGADERRDAEGQWGVRIRESDTYYPNLPAFVELYVAHMWPYQQGVMTKFQWVPEWWRYPALVGQLDAMWRAYEHARKQPGSMFIFNIQAFGLLDRVFNKDTGLVRSLGVDADKCKTDVNEPLPCVRPPKGWRREVMSQLRAERSVEPEPMENTRPRNMAGRKERSR
ncbi:DUF4913 domain-containing protein [Bifidobacterium lemurum]|nr:DUF4913 domain-containing protein [Bifidobacterium lemurum]